MAAEQEAARAQTEKAEAARLQAEKGAADQSQPEEAESDVVVAALAAAGDLFARVDVDSNGQLDVQELGALMHSLGYTCDESYIEATIAKFDKNNDGTISIDEFTDIVKVLAPALAKQAEERHRTFEEQERIVAEEAHAEAEEEHSRKKPPSSTQGKTKGPPPVPKKKGAGPSAAGKGKGPPAVPKKGKSAGGPPPVPKKKGAGAPPVPKKKGAGAPPVPKKAKGDDKPPPPPSSDAHDDSEMPAG